MTQDTDDGYTRRGIIKAGTSVVDVRGNAVTIACPWTIDAERNVGGIVMFIRDEDPYYVWDSDVIWLN